MNARELLQLDDINFLRELTLRYPEAAYLAGKADASPQGNQILKSDALAYRVFGPDVKVDLTAIEADRTFLGLLTLKWVLTDQYDKFTANQKGSEKLSEESFKKLKSYTDGVISNEESLEFCLYSLACNDLGKTHFLVEKYKEIFGREADDHDQLLCQLVQNKPELFPAYQNFLSLLQQESYIRGMEANLNLGQFVQGENLPINLQAMQKIDKISRELRLICELYDFAGIRGHINACGSSSMTEKGFLAFSSAIDELMQEPLDQAYHRYIMRRGSLVGFSSDTAETFALSRIATLSGASNKIEGDIIKSVWDRITENQRAILERELNKTGMDGNKGIILYYAPAVIANATIATGRLEKGIEYALQIFSTIFEQTRNSEKEQLGNGVITVNISEYAHQAACLAKTHLGPQPNI